MLVKSRIDAVVGARVTLGGTERRPGSVRKSKKLQVVLSLWWAQSLHGGRLVCTLTERGARLLLSERQDFIDFEGLASVGATETDISAALV